MSIRLRFLDGGEARGPGGRTIINTVLGLVLGIVDFGLGMQEAVDAPRSHHQWLPDRLTPLVCLWPRRGAESTACPNILPPRSP